MTPGRDAFDAFSRELDAAVTRERIRRALGSLPPPVEEDAAELSQALDAADPLGEAEHRRWTVAIRELVRVWPGRVAVAAALAATLVIGLLVGRLVTLIPSPTTVADAPPLPAYRPELAVGSGFIPSTKPESERKFGEAMAHYGRPDFVERAMPLLRDAVAADASNDQAQFWLGVVLLRERRSAEAIVALEAATRLAPADRMYKGYLLYAYLQAGALERARKLQQELLETR